MSRQCKLGAAIPALFVFVWLVRVLIPNEVPIEVPPSLESDEEHVVTTKVVVPAPSLLPTVETPASTSLKLGLPPFPFYGNNFSGNAVSDTVARGFAVQLLQDLGTIPFRLDPPRCTQQLSSRSSYQFRPAQITLEQGSTVKVDLVNTDPAMARGGEIFRLQLISTSVSTVFDVRDAGTGTYHATISVGRDTPAGKYALAAQRVFACQESLLDYWCVFNYSAPPGSKCPMEGRAPELRELALVVGTASLVVTPASPLPPPPGQCVSGKELRGVWVRKENVILNEPPCLTKPVYCIHDTLTQRAEYFPTTCTPPPFNLETCTRDKFLIFIGDSTLRNIYYATSRLVLKVNTTGSLPAGGTLQQLSPKWKSEEGWAKKANYFTQKKRNPVYFAWASHVEIPAPPLTDFFPAFRKWQEYFKFYNKTPHVIWGMGAHSPGMNLSVTYNEVNRHASQLGSWMQQTGGKVTNVHIKAVRQSGRGLHPVYNNARIAAKNELAAVILAQHGIPTVDLFHPTLSFWTNWEYHGDNIHYKDWVDHVLRDLLLPFVCTQ